MKIVELLLRHGADTSLVNENEWNALHAACQQGHAAIVAQLVAAGAQLNAKSREGWTALALACSFVGLGFAGCARILLEHDADVNVLNTYKEIPLMRACQCGNIDCALLCIEYGAAIEHKGRRNRTPLLMAAERGHVAVCKLLCSFGVDREFIDMDGLDAIRTARAFRRTEAADWLESTRQWTTPLHHLQILPLRRATALLNGGANVHARATPDAPSPVDLASSLEREGKATDGTAAALVLSWWRSRVYALAMGTHARLGEVSPLLKLAGKPELLVLIVCAAAAA